MIEVQDLAKRFGKVQAVDGASFTARNGAITTLLGANGSGKTTTLNMLMGLLKPDRGTALVDGIVVQGSGKETQRLTGWFPDAVGLYHRLTSREHMRYFGELHGMEGKTLEQAIDRTIAELQMEEIADRRTEGFSTGQRMKVALARALVHSPPNIVLDEPTRGLDVVSVRLLRETLRKLRADGRCILMSSHVMAEVQELSDHIIVVSEGQVVADGNTQELIARTGAPDLEEAFVRLAVKS
ncbi:MAG TPA: ATP-binding cassette domain-containing protein [Allosphingosinicella sp.]|nr:ATP-binding cassette domain-containing protein [Allosphingosinicella sp.]